MARSRGFWRPPLESRQFIDGKRVVLRPLVKEDAATVCAWFNDPEVTASMNKGHYPNTPELQEKRILAQMGDPENLQLGIVDRSSGKLVGTIGLHKISWIHRTADISIVIGEKDGRGKGLGREAIGLLAGHAFRKMNLNKLTAGMWSSNKASQKCFVANGFRLEGRRRAQYFCRGRYVDDLNYGLLRPREGT